MLAAAATGLASLVLLRKRARRDRPVLRRYPSPAYDKSAPEDVFDRQRDIEGWDQELLQKQRCLVLGSGGLGCGIALALARLGVAKIMLVDYEAVDASNLNRQLLFGPSDVGKRKVDAAAEALRRGHNVRSEIETADIDVTKYWQTVVRMAREADVIFNCIDIGDYFDYAACSLALKNSIPYVAGGTFATSAFVDYVYPGGSPCWACLSPLERRDVTEKLRPGLIETYSTLEFVPGSDKPKGLSNVWVCTIGSQLLVAAWNQALCGDRQPERTMYYLKYNTIDKFDGVTPEADCPLCSGDDFPRRVVDKEKEEDEEEGKKEE